ncbi:DMT family transporter [Streptacidiphilus jiangxiensis]|uniref:Quaternary ammonium compound-resistance protein SugE n=1 Tax=Streptacidiphilus jiangxiensis TaxID=235985 RepID=A0A1H7YLU3_STRJI|nr:SMR family transporter [Streptacidiphilus jiangxiensis]SEM46129.1 quaternary ammonium compound-resistance protein SugE [Streptacidiphilus jiangxiensis]
MAWIVLLFSGILETVWAVALQASKGFSRPLPSIVFGITVVLSMAGLSYALRSVPLGTGYAVWVAVGTVGTALYGMFALGEPVTVARALFLAMIVGGVVGLKLAH